jgi:hypothetical protein
MQHLIESQSDLRCSSGMPIDRATYESSFEEKPLQPEKEEVDDDVLINIDNRETNKERK